MANIDTLAPLPPENTEELTGFLAEIQGIAPDLSVEQAAFETIHNDITLDGENSPAIINFISRLIEHRVPSCNTSQRALAALQIGERIYAYGGELLGQYSENMDELDRRVIMWSRYLRPHVGDELTPQLDEMQAAWEKRLLEKRLSRS